MEGILTSLIVIYHGPVTESDHTRPACDEGETLNHLVGSWRIFQLRRGHRYSTDDVLAAWTGARALPRAEQVLDLGAGVGSVGLLVLHRLGDAARLTSVEVQAVSAALARKTVAYNGLGERVRILHGDLRDAQVLEGTGTHDLVVANPPYLPPGAACASPNAQRAAARLELHGDVFDYCRAAARVLAPGGRFCFCHNAGDDRPPRAVAEAGLQLLWRQEVLFRHGRPPSLALHCCGWEGQQRCPAPLIVRGADGRWTEQLMDVRRTMGLEP